MWLIKKDGTKRPLRTMVNDTIVKGERYETLCAGGGGWGNPLDRDIARVVQDVKDTYVTVGKAKNVYGVVMDPDTLEVDYAATEALRKEKKAAQSA